MNQVELLRHVADNLEAGRPAGHGLLYKGKKSAATRAETISFEWPDEYSLAPRTRIINGIEVPAPMDKEPETGSRYWIEYAGMEGFVICSLWYCDDIDKLRLSRGLCHDSPEAAAANCKARYGIE